MEGRKGEAGQIVRSDRYPYVGPLSHGLGELSIPPRHQQDVQMLSRLACGGTILDFHILFAHDHDSSTHKTHIGSEVGNSVFHM